MFPINPCAHTIWAPSSLFDDPELSVDFYDVPQLPLALKDTWVYEHTVCVSPTLSLVLPFFGIARLLDAILLTVCHISQERQEEVLLYLQLPPHCGDSPLCTLCIHYHAMIPPVPSRGQDCGCVLYYPLPSA